MQKIFFSREELSRKYDVFLLSLPENSSWYNLSSASDPTLLEGIIEQWHRLGIMSFSLSADGRRFKKDFNVNEELVVNSLNILKHE